MKQYFVGKFTENRGVKKLTQGFVATWKRGKRQKFLRSTVKCPVWEGEEQEKLSGKKETIAPQLNISEDNDWREFRAKLVELEQTWTSNQTSYQKQDQSTLETNQNQKNLNKKNNDNSIWAHLISSPEKGSILVARAEDLGFFNNTAVLLLQHEDRRGTLGLILNRPSPLTVRDVFTRPDVTSAFGAQVVYFGGPVGYDRINVIHSKQIIKGVSEILAGVYIGGIEDACKMIQQGDAKAEEFRLMFGYCGWDPWQLAAELHDDTWYTVSASRQLILQLIFESNSNEQKQQSAWEFLLQSVQQVT